MTIDSAGVPEAPCSGQRHPDGECSTCGHLTAEHDRRLVCSRCHEVCRFCGQFYDQHADSEWQSCQIDADEAEATTDHFAWWRSQQ
jgi:hypothetical protein